MYICIKASRTDPIRTGCVVRLASIPGHPLCPIKVCCDLLSFRQAHPGPLFLFADGQSLKRKFVVAFLRVALPHVRNINTPSFRIGGASAAMATGASDALIRIMGRWPSDCYKRYIRMSDRQVGDFQCIISRAPTPPSTWNPDT